MIDVLSAISERSGLGMPLQENQTSVQPGWGNGLGNIAPGLIAEVGGNGAGTSTFGRFSPSFSAMQTGHGAVIIVGVLVLALVAFHVSTRGFQS